MIVRRPGSLDEMRRIVEEALRGGRLLYVAAHPCPACERFEAALEELGAAGDDRIVKLEVPPDDWAVDYVLNELGVPGAPTVILPGGRVLDDPDPVELALKTCKELRGRDCLAG